jgi:hypothetical protein
MLNRRKIWRGFVHKSALGTRSHRQECWAGVIFTGRERDNEPAVSRSPVACAGFRIIDPVSVLSVRMDAGDLDAAVL